jgi:hypothetical protein
MLFNQMKTIKSRVKFLLEKYPALREDDFRLYATYISFQVGGKTKLEQINAYEFLTRLANGDLAHFESVRRDRQKLQEQVPELRGANYEKRKRGGDSMSKNIHDL